MSIKRIITCDRCKRDTEGNQLYWTLECSSRHTYDSDTIAPCKEMSRHLCLDCKKSYNQWLTSGVVVDKSFDRDWET